MKRFVCIALTIMIIGAMLGCSNAKYGEQIIEAQNAMLHSGADAEDICNMICDVWNNAIYKKASWRTDKYTKYSADGFWDDFNIALNAYTISDEYRSAAAEVEESRAQVARLMKAFKKPPKKYEDAYEMLEELYDLYKDFVVMIEPSGNYNNYSAAFTTADNEFMKKYEELKLELSIIGG